MIVAFDLGGVLVDVDRRALDVLGQQTRAALFAGDRHDRFTTGLLDVDEWTSIGDRAQVHAAWTAVVAWSAGGLALLQETAAHTPCLLWSNTDPLHWQALEASVVVDVDVSLSFRLGVAKPDPRFFALALAGRDPASVLFLDDREENVAAAVAAGVDAVLCRGVAESRAILGDRL
jgi:FMN phosphatase YigB (HAD superfamily)